MCVYFLVKRLFFSILFYFQRILRTGLASQFQRILRAVLAPQFRRILRAVLRFSGPGPPATAGPSLWSRGRLALRNGNSGFGFADSECHLQPLSYFHQRHNTPSSDGREPRGREGVHSEHFYARGPSSRALARRVGQRPRKQYTRRESNPDLKNRNLQFYPLNYGCVLR